MDKTPSPTPISTCGYLETASYPSPTPLSTASPFPVPLPFSPFLNFDSFEPQFESSPQPLETLYETPIPPFLSKTYDLVDDTSLDAIISWGENGDSFVVWDHVEFARSILPKNFKHNNFSSFVRQLNTYVANGTGMSVPLQGFRKIDMDKWEFASEGFKRGHKHLLKNIQRRKTHHSQQIGSSSGPSQDSNKAALEAEIEHLRKDRSLMMLEVVELRNQQRDTAQHIELVNKKLQTSEKRQKHMVQFLGKIFQNPAFLARLKQKNEQKGITSPRTMRKFVKHQSHEMGLHPLLEMGNNPVFNTENAPSQLEGITTTTHGFLGTPEQDTAARGTEDPLCKVNGVVGPQTQLAPDHFISFPDDLKKEKSFHELIMAETEGTAVEENIWSMGFESGIGMSGSSNELLGNVSDYSLQELGDIWDIDSI
ncbi:Heat stress transcription factor A-3 [Castilleja foliolosa]|uniref:Heat stress transcription factor A-3 n=1 Tax=Castilleja foliolosa TaxID=1961234 RepID=A0ABD3C2I7_9LAMI